MTPLQSRGAAVHGARLPVDRFGPPRANAAGVYAAHRRLEADRLHGELFPLPLPSNCFGIQDLRWFAESPGQTGGLHALQAVLVG